MNKFFIAAAFTASAFLLSACAPNQAMLDAKRKDAEFAQSVKNIDLETADVGKKPANYEALVEAAIRGQLKDPDSAQFSGITKPKKEVMVEQSNFVYGYSSCVFVNAKNSYGGYTGKQLYWVFIRNDQVLRIKNTNDAYGNIIFVGRPVNCS